MTKEEAQKELSRLTEQIDTLIDNRQVFIEDNMHLFADFKLGQIVINKDTLQRGEVVSHYQATYGEPARSLHHDCFNVHCNIDILDYENKRRGIIDNTSRHMSKPWMDCKEWWKWQQNLI